MYQLDGDRLRICLAQHSLALKAEQRPKEFAVEPQSADVLLTLERYRPSGDEKATEGDWAFVEELHDGTLVPPDMLRNQSLTFWRGTVDLPIPFLGGRGSCTSAF